MNTIPIYQAGTNTEHGIKLASNEAPLGSSPKVIEAIKATAHTIYRYPNAQHDELHAILAHKHGVTTQNILCGNGSDELISFITQKYIQQNDAVIVSQPSFPIYGIASVLSNARILTLPLKNWHIDLDAILNSITEHTKIIFLCSPNNPTGTCIAPQNLLSFLHKIPHSIYIALDLAYFDFAETKYKIAYNTLLSAHPNIMILHTMSKSYGLAGLRLGYLIANEPVVSQLRPHRMPFNINRLALVSATVALNDTVYYNNTLAHVHKERERLYTHYEVLGCNPIKSQANFITLFPPSSKRLPQSIDSNNRAQSLFHYFLQQQPSVSIRPLHFFGLDSAIRISIGTQEENNIVLSILSSLYQDT